ncbi:nucleotidyltransferase family protein [Gracilibacillus oryzae]|uniref:Nucleotidyltransferase family protein n=1 Tax=Gracilibacillus oryzae TaxID=1672701 RepID=A0A7C8KQG1_9BACI|nr:nucleotidyltransferase family protein [Gracilibacillus oryzae]KAB8127937.1 nucleotidyltransferase family protein [Gracilibacillus oryzae]
MKAIILAAGYATRLYPLTKNTAKALLEIDEKPIIAHLLDKINEVKNINQVYIVTNAKFYQDFNKWADKYKGTSEIMILNDGTDSNENRLGAIGDIAFVLQNTEIEEDILVMAADNLFTFDLPSFVDFFHQKQSDCITVQVMEDRQELQRTGVVETDHNNKVISFEEKPVNPKSKLAAPPLYLYKKDTLPLFAEYLGEVQNPDAPGNFIPWLIDRKGVYAHFVTGECYDIGTLESYEKVKVLYQSK